ncbi:hypothetical protein R1CP_36070 (plasmid) [Rhodococcus opacus]|uniref:Uncharacterized protein n=1 Tax=Rhodococcus opacus TaxID=37919 RepID=A0A1B1KGW7_RHOOP|nr:hypothetical protein R1CP_36070 [Rhodococcus opacus]
MRPAPLPRGPGQGGADRRHEAGVGVGGHQLHPGQAAGHQRPEERQPTGPVLGGGHLDSQDFPVTLGVHSDRDQGVHVHHPPVLPDLEDEGVGGDERVRAGVQGSATERLHLGVEVLRHHRHLGFRQ